MVCNVVAFHVKNSFIYSEYINRLHQNKGKNTWRQNCKDVCEESTVRKQLLLVRETIAENLVHSKHF